MHDDEYASLISDTSNRPEITADQKKRRHLGWQNTCVFCKIVVNTGLVLASNVIEPIGNSQKKRRKERL
jgi:hypothetical protein